MKEELDKIYQQLSHVRGEFRRHQQDQAMQYNRRRIAEHPNPITRCGQQLFSQSDEDGVTLEILRRLDMLQNDNNHPFRYAEIGVETGVECNTLVLAALGWSGVWIDQVDMCYEIPNPSRLTHIKARVNRDNVHDLLSRPTGDASNPFTESLILLDQQIKDAGIEQDHPVNLDVLSIDVDGLDYHLCEALMQDDPYRRIQPALLIVEYNADFPPPVQFVQDYDEDYGWDGSNYYGASLQSFSDMFERNDYSLVACNAASGCNAFFVRTDLFNTRAFSDVPLDIRDIYVPPHYQLDVKFSHGRSVETVKHVLR